MNKKLRLAGSILLLAYLGWATDWRHVSEALTRVRWGLWLAGLAVYVATQVVSSVRWQMLARPLGFRQPWGQFVAYYFIGMFFNLVLPTSVGGDVVRAWYLDNRSGRRSAAMVSVLLDRGSGLCVLLALACVAAALAPVQLPAFIAWSVWGLAAAAAAGLASLPLLLRWTNRFARLRPVVEAMGVYRREVRLMVLATLLSVFVQAANVVLVWLIGAAMGLPVPPLYYWILVPVVTLVTLVPVSLNGMGLREAATVFLLAPLGIETGTALSLAFLWFLSFSVVSLVGVGYYWWGQFPRFEVRADDGSVGCDSDQGRTRQSRAAA